nr:hypothetical protein REQ54_01257 [Rhizobium sp. Q54]
MFLRLTVAAAVLVVPFTAIAQTSDICRSLERRLAVLPQVIGSTAEVRRHAEALRYHDGEIRHLRTQMRRARCGAGSIVTFGQRDDICGEMAQALRELEQVRDSIAAQQSAARQILRPNGERNAILAALDANGCRTDTAAEPLPAALEPSPPPREEPQERPYSGITVLSPKAGTAPAAAPPPPPEERPYDPSRKVRTVGPVFLPDESSIDLANPAGAGPQPRQ